MIEDCFRSVEELLAQSSAIHSWSITYDKRSSYVGFLRGEIRFVDRSVLHLREFVYPQHNPERYMYAYHYQGPDGALIFRYDSTPHLPEIQNAPHHKHVTGHSVEPPQAPGLDSVLGEIGRLVARSRP